MPHKTKPLVQRAQQYRTRFGHPVPPQMWRAVADEMLSPEDLMAQMDEALRSGQPVMGWAEYEPIPRSVEAQFLGKPRQGHFPEHAGIVQFAKALDFAARKHVNQRRKGEAREPYLNHLAEVAQLIAEATGNIDPNLVIAGLLHDTIEDTPTTHDELVAQFGADIADLVREVTDNKTLSKAERKQLQIEHAPHLSSRAKMIKTADLTSNLRSIMESPPQAWDETRKRKYFEWAAKVIAGCRGCNPYLENAFDQAYANSVDRRSSLPPGSPGNRSEG